MTRVYWNLRWSLQTGHLKALADVQVLAPHSATVPVAAQAPEALEVNMMSPAPGVDHPRTR